MLTQKAQLATHQGPGLGDHIDVIQDCAAPRDLGS